MADRGRPKARVTIVEEIINKDDLTENNYFLRDIHQITSDVDCTIEFLATVGLLHNSAICCDRPMGFVNRQRCTDGRAWNCSMCKSYRSIRQESFFSGSRIRLPRLVELIYWWAAIDCKQSDVMEQVGIGTEAIVNWFNYFRDICAMWCIDHPIKIGGHGVVVDIAESKFMHRQCHRGRYREGHWILGMVERHSLKCVLVPVPDQSGATLLPIITEHVLPGTRIVTDGWHAYELLPNPVNHRLEFVDPNDETLPTNTTEGTWINVKNKYRTKHGPSDKLFSTYLQEFSWRRAHKENIFMAFIYWIRHYYPV